MLEETVRRELMDAKDNSKHHGGADVGASQPPNNALQNKSRSALGLLRATAASSVSDVTLSQI